MAAQLRTTLRVYPYVLQHMVASLYEARIRQYAADQIDFFVEAFECGVNDCAIDLRPGTSHNGEGAADILFEQLRNHREEKVLAPLDVKCCTARQGSRKNVQFYVQMSPAQWQTCQAVFIGSPKEPEFVILVPVHYLPRAMKSEGVHLSPVRPLWTLHPLSAFPPGYTPFVIPVAQLGNALKNMRAHFIQSSCVWGNEYTGANFTGLPPPKLFDVSVLEPTTNMHLKARDQIGRCYEAFREHSTRFQVDLIGARPLFGDLKLVEMYTQREVFVELKSGKFEVFRDETSGLEVLQHEQWTGIRGCFIFSWKAQWDYLLTEDPMRNMGYMLPRDKIPTDWFNASAPLLTMQNFQKYRVDLRRSVQLVRSVEKILDTMYAETDSMRAQKEISTRCPLDEPSDEIEHDLGQESFDLFSQPHWSTNGFRRGFGSAKHEELRGKTYAVWMSEVLIELCRARGQGLVLDFGMNNPICHFAIVRYLWSEADKMRYDRDGEPAGRVWNLPKNTPVVPLSFIGSNWTGNWQPRGNRNLMAGLVDIASRPGSIVVLDLYPET